MKVSKRRAPVDFGRPEDDQFAELGPPPEPQPESLAEPEADQPVAVRAERPPVPERAVAPAASALSFEERGPSGWPIWLVAVGISVLWALAPVAFAVGYRNNVAPLQYDRFALAVFTLLAVGPAAFVLGAAYMIRQAQKLAHEARRSQAMAHDMLSPTLLAAARAGDVAQVVREEISRAGAAAHDARETLIALRDALAFETDRLVGATAQSVRTTEELAGVLGRERTEMTGLAQTLDAQATRVADAISQQARMVTDATGVAQAQIREAETTLQARAADLTAAAGEASNAARAAGEDLTRHIARLETAGSGVAEQVRAVESGLVEQRAALVAVTQALKGDHEAFAERAEAHAARLGQFIEETRASAAEMSERALSGGEALRQLMLDATLQFRDLSETAKAEREEFGQSTLHALEAVSSAAAEQRAQLQAQTQSAIDALAVAAEQTRAAAERHAAAARDQVDQLSEAAFGAGQKANQVFEARLEEARALIEQSSRMVEDAGAATAKKLADGASAARAALDELTAMLGQLEAKAAELPAAARGQADQVRAAVSDGMEELMLQARRTAQEAQQIDAAFQERVRRNFEMLSEAVRLMGVAAVASPAPGVPAAAPQFAAPERTLAPPEPEPEPVAPVADAAAEVPAPADSLGLRSRIRLTPIASDREFSAVFAAAGGPPVAVASSSEADDGEESGETGEPWTWKDLLASLDSAEADGQRLEDSLGDDLAQMGVDTHKLLPKAKVEAIAAALQTGDVDGCREVVRKLAPAATRRIARRLFTDDDVKRRTEIYVRRYKTLVEDAVGRDPAGRLLEGLLDADGGRIFLLLDAAAGDMI